MADEVVAVAADEAAADLVVAERGQAAECPVPHPPPDDRHRLALRLPDQRAARRAPLAALVLAVPVPVELARAALGRADLEWPVGLRRLG